MMNFVVSPVDQRLSVGEDEVNTTDSPAQKVVAPLAVIVGTGGFGFIVTVSEADAPEAHPA